MDTARGSAADATLSAASASTGTPSGNAILAYLHSRKHEFVAFLEKLTLVESPSSSPETQHRPREIIAERLQQSGFHTMALSGKVNGGNLFARPAERQRGRPLQMMVGHYDTVWPLGTLEHMPFVHDANVIKGPGVYDMKGGITQIIFALETIRHFGLEMPLTPVIFANSDEEIGSRESTHHIARLARVADRAFVLEPSLGRDGKLKTARKGVGRFTVTIRGQAAHAGLDPEKGASAILELAHVVQTLFALNDPEKGVTVNVGTIEGGLRPNVVAPESGAVVDVRVATREDAERVTAAIHGMQASVPGTSLAIEGGIGRPALEPTPRNRALWELARSLAADIGLELDQALAGGGSDGNTTSLYTATLDGLGPVGDGAHAPHEFLYLDETLARTALLVKLLLSASTRGET
ncbi:MAG: carboxypeptidase [Gammaproteobacteria bacterium]|nr:MAG: carboxypeptidase [Gammaproteobacteria bacterium]